MARYLRVGLPSGSLYNRCIMHLREAGYDVLETPDRDFRCGVSNGIEFIQANRRTMALLVTRGFFDAGITGQDLLLHSRCRLIEYCELPFAKQSDQPSRWVLACKPGFEEGRIALDSRGISEQRLAPVKIGCELMHFAKIVLGTINPPLPFDYDLVPIEGSEELCVASGIVDMALVVTETGSSIKANNLVILPGYSNLFESVPAIYISSHLPLKKQTTLEELALSMRSVISASAVIELEFHFPDDPGIGILDLPSDLAPTISTLSTPDWHEGKIVIPRTRYPEILRRLSVNGARDIVRKTVQGHLP